MIGRRAALALLLLTACTEKKTNDGSFPKDFTFGVATAGFQSEMGCPTIPAASCEDPNSDWYQWITTPSIRGPGYIVGGPPSTGPGLFELYPQDLALAKNEMHVGAIRLGIEWSRLFPTSTVGVEGYDALHAIASTAGLDYYHRLFAEVKKQGLKPLVTVNHYTLPLWIHDGVACHEQLGADATRTSCDKGGWLDPKTITEIAKFAGFVGKEYGGDVDTWATLNEPLAIPLSGFLQPGASRSNPPGVLLRGDLAKVVIMNEIEAHARMYDALKANDTVDIDGDGKASQIGLVFNLAPVYPVDPSNSLDVEAAKNVSYLYNELFLNATIKGKLDVNATGAADAIDRPDLARMDYLGLNYYNRINLVGASETQIPNFSPLLTADFFNEKTNFYDFYTPGIYEMIQLVESKYDRIPIIVTENGTGQGADALDAPLDCAEYLAWVQRAIYEGADVRGYFWWTLVDNYEWNHGMDEFKLGLYAVDPNDPAKKRTARPIVSTYARIASERKIPDDLAKKAPIE